MSSALATASLCLAPQKPPRVEVEACIMTPCRLVFDDASTPNAPEREDAQAMQTDTITPRRLVFESPVAPDAPQRAVEAVEDYELSPRRLVF